MLENNKVGKVLGFGEVMIKFTPPNYNKISQSATFEYSFGGGESNVINSLSKFGIESKYATVLPNNSLGEKYLRELKGNNIDISAITCTEGRFGTYYLEPGYGVIGSNVIYDRKYSCIAMAKEEDFNIEEILKDVKILVVSGITPALSEDLKVVTLKLIKAAREKGVTVVYDSNYRAKLWTLEEAGTFLKEVLNYVDIALLGMLDMTNILKYQLEDPKEDFNENLKALYKKLFDVYPNLKAAACTKRTVHSINKNSLQGFVFNGGELYPSQTHTFDILDRVGGGDAFTAGIVYGLITEGDATKIAEFATAASVMKHAIRGDVNLVTAEDVKGYMNVGIQNIKR